MAKTSVRRMASENELKTTIGPVAPVQGEERTEIPPPNPVPQEISSPKIRNLIIKDFWVWLGVGANYTSNMQTVEGFSDVEYGHIKAPSVMARGGFFLSDSFGLDLGYKTTPGEAKSSSSLSVRDGAYTWQIMSAEALYRMDRDLSRKADWTWRLGVQLHQFPFMVPESASLVKVTENSMANLSLGMEYKRQIREKMRFEWLMRYQYPLGQLSDAGSSFSVSPKFSFDGSIGSAYEVRDDFFLGLYWYGQYQKFGFNYRNLSGTDFSGTQSLFFSNFDLRLGWEF